MAIVGLQQVAVARFSVTSISSCTALFVAVMSSRRRDVEPSP
jgi:hypothetical protein